MTLDINFSKDVNLSGETLSVDDCDFKNKAFFKNAIFKNTVFKSFAHFTGVTFNGKADFKGAIFYSFADFTGVKFSGEVDFTGAIFEDGASFENAEFDSVRKPVSFKDAVFKPPKKSEKGVSFEGAKFGLPYQTAFGEWEFRFGKIGETYIIRRRKKGSDKKAISIGGIDDFVSTEDLANLLKKWGMADHEEEALEAFRIFGNNPTEVSFENCRFGEIDINKISEEEVKEIAVKERKRIGKLWSTKDKETADQALKEFEKYYSEKEPKSKPAETQITGILLIIARHLGWANLPETGKSQQFNVYFSKVQCYNQSRILFSNATFINGGYVDFYSTAFSNGGNVSFNSAAFSNGGSVSFHSATFLNSGDVNFYYAKFSNGRSVSFHSATFLNSGYVNFYYAKFSNGESVSFQSAAFSNGGSVDFDSAAFSNGVDVNFNFATFSNGRHVNFTSTNFSNGKDVGFNSAAFSNRGDVDFYSAAFSNGEDVDFRSATFDNKGMVDFKETIWINGGALLFHSCSFGEMASARFIESLFLCGEEIDFINWRTPEKGSMMFQRCHFIGHLNPDKPEEPKVDFNGSFFHQTTFEGGKVGWLSKLTDAEKIKVEAILEERKIKPPPENADWFNEIKKQKIPVNTPVFDDDCVVSWKDLTSESAKNLTFRLTNLYGSIFDGMTLSHVELNAPTWKEMDDRNVLYEEYLFEEQKGKLSAKEQEKRLRNIENQYTQLKTNLENQGNYIHAGDFHYGEQEMRRLIGDMGRVESFFTNCYRIFAGYGEKPLWAGFWLFVLIFGFPLVSLVINGLWNVRPISDLLDINDGWAVFLNYVNTLVKLITPFSWKGEIGSITVSTLPKNVILITGQILLFIQLPLFIMAVRRRFKR